MFALAMKDPCKLPDDVQEEWFKRGAEVLHFRDAASCPYQRVSQIRGFNASFLFVYGRGTAPTPFTREQLSPVWVFGQHAWRLSGSVNYRTWSSLGNAWINCQLRPGYQQSPQQLPSIASRSTERGIVEEAPD